MHHEFQTDDFPSSYANVWKRVVSEPRAFFQEMPVTGGLLNPFLFLLISLAVTAVVYLIFGPRPFALRFVFGEVMRAFVGAAVLTLIARQIFSGTGNYEATFRVVAYAAAPLALLWIPLIGKLAALYTVFLTIIGLERAHGFDAVKSVLTVILAIVVMYVLAWTFGAPWLWYAHSHAYRC